MTRPDPRIADFFARPRRWQAELSALRAVLTHAPLQETFKWRGPCYTAHGGNVATIWAFRDHCALGFFKGVLLRDPEDLLSAPGENSRSVRVLNFTGVAQIKAAVPALKDFIAQAIALEAEGRKVDLPKDDLPYSSELEDALAADPELAAAFEALTPGRRRGWVLHFSQPKMAETRAGRIGKAAPRIRDGKGMHDR